MSFGSFGIILMYVWQCHPEMHAVVQVDDSLHMQFTDTWFTENVIDKFLRGHAM